MSGLRAHREAGAVRSRSPGWGVKAAVTLVLVLLRETAVAVAASDDLAATRLGFRKGLLAGFVRPADDGGDKKTADDDAEDDADGGHGVAALGLAVVDVPGQNGKAVGRAGAGEGGGCVGAVEAGAGTAVAHDPGRHGHVEAVDSRGHIGCAGGTGVVAALVDGGEMHFRSVEGCRNGGVGECGELIDFQTLRMIVKHYRSTCGCFASLRVDGERNWHWREAVVSFCVKWKCRTGSIIKAIVAVANTLVNKEKG